MIGVIFFVVSFTYLLARIAVEEWKEICREFDTLLRADKIYPPAKPMQVVPGHTTCKTTVSISRAIIWKKKCKNT